MKRYCQVCYREIAINKKGKVCRHGFRKNRWIFEDEDVENIKYKKVDGTPCSGTGKIGLTHEQMERKI